MVAPLVAIGAIGARWLAGRALTAMFGSVTRAAVTTTVADQTLNDGRLTASAASTVGNGLTGMFRRAVGLDGPDGQLDWTRIAGLGVAATVGTMVLDKMMSTPMAVIAALALTYLFRDQISGMANSAVDGLRSLANPDETPAPARALPAPQPQ